MIYEDDDDLNNHAINLSAATFDQYYEHKEKNLTATNVKTRDIRINE